MLRNVTIRMREREVVTVLGLNGAGKSTLLKAVFGLLPLTHGTISVRGHLVSSPTPRRLLERGVGYMPQGARVMPGLTVAESLKLAAEACGDHSRNIQNMLELFPALRTFWKRRAETLSGGERQMLALASTLVRRPHTVLLDEPTHALAPKLARTVLDQIAVTSKELGTAFLVVEQRVRDALAVASRVYVLHMGSVRFEGDPAGLGGNAGLRSLYLQDRIDGDSATMS